MWIREETVWRFGVARQASSMGCSSGQVSTMQATASAQKVGLPGSLEAEPPPSPVSASGFRLLRPAHRRASSSVLSVSLSSLPESFGDGIRFVLLDASSFTMEASVSPVVSSALSVSADAPLSPSVSEVSSSVPWVVSEASTASSSGPKPPAAAEQSLHSLETIAAATGQIPRFSWFPTLCGVHIRTARIPR